jgi:hypothetical protein
MPTAVEATSQEARVSIECWQSAPRSAVVMLIIKCSSGESKGRSTTVWIPPTPPRGHSESGFPASSTLSGSPGLEMKTASSFAGSVVLLFSASRWWVLGSSNQLSPS